MEADKRSLVIGILLTVALCFIPIFTITGIMISEKIRVDELYERSRDGILIEDKFLKHAEVVDYGGTTGRCLEATDGYSFEIFAKAGDWYHFHYESTDIDCVMFYIYGDGWGHGINLGSQNNRDFEITESGTYRIEVWNYDDENDGYITSFLIVYDEYYPPECPLCN